MHARILPSSRFPRATAPVRIVRARRVVLLPLHPLGFPLRQGFGNTGVACLRTGPRRSSFVCCAEEPPSGDERGSTLTSPSVRDDWEDNMALLSVENLQNEVARLKEGNERLREKLEAFDRSQAELSAKLAKKDQPKEPISHEGGSVKLATEEDQTQEPTSQKEESSEKEERSNSSSNKKREGWEILGSRMSVVYVSAEVSPWSKTGGLGDVAGSLPIALADLGHRVMVVTPRYLNGANEELYSDVEDLECKVTLELGRMGTHEVGYFHVNKKGVDWVFVDHPCFHRPGGPYGDESGIFGDNMFRYAVLSMASCEAPLHLKLMDTATGTASIYGEELVMVANDWHAGLVPVYLEHKYRANEVFSGAKSVLAIHNLAHQGIENPSSFHSLGLPQCAFGSLEWVAEDGHQSMNIMKGAIATSDRIVTVSRKHAWDITSKEGGMGLFPISSARADVMNGITNGIDTEEWDPQNDKYIEATYSYDDMEGKARCKASLQKELGFLVSPAVPLIGFVGRLDHQKGPDLVLHALDALSIEHCQVVMLGDGHPDIEGLMKEKEMQHRDFFRGWVGYSVPVSHKIIAGCDILLIPSRFEPCGLIQFYAMRYGTLPVAHATGGLSDTIEDFNPFGDNEESIGTGWTFHEPTVDSMLKVIKTAIKTFRREKKKWRHMQHGMLDDYSWSRSARLYQAVFRTAMEGEGGICETESEEGSSRPAMEGEGGTNESENEEGSFRTAMEGEGGSSESESEEDSLDSEIDIDPDKVSFLALAFDSDSDLDVAFDSDSDSDLGFDSDSDSDLNVNVEVEKEKLDTNRDEDMAGVKPKDEEEGKEKQET